MLTADELKAALSEEIRLIRHLASKIDADRIDWRPTQGQRSTIELLRYLTICGIGPVLAILADDWELISGLAAEHEALNLAAFDAAMETQERELHAALDGLSESELQEREGKLPWGASMPLSQAFFATSVRFLNAYRMQLFLYLKQSGAGELSTYNAWMGTDAPEKTPEKTPQKTQI